MHLVAKMKTWAPEKRHNLNNLGSAKPAIMTRLHYLETFRQSIRHFLNCIINIKVLLSTHDLKGILQEQAAALHPEVELDRFLQLEVPHVQLVVRRVVAAQQVNKLVNQWPRHRTAELAKVLQLQNVPIINSWYEARFHKPLHYLFVLHESLGHFLYQRVMALACWTPVTAGKIIILKLLLKKILYIWTRCWVTHSPAFKLVIF